MNLIDLKPFLDDVTDSFAAVLDLEFTIINSEPMQRVSGTGAYRDVHRKHWEGTYSAMVKKTGKPMVVLEPSESRLEPELFKQNPQYAIILYPIARGDRMEGVIVLASFTPGQKKTITERTQKLLNYLEKIASLILAKLEQERLLEELTAGNAQLSEVFESVQDGLLLCGLGKGIMQINTRGKNLLRMDDASPQAERLREEVMEVAREALDRHQILERQVDCRADQWERSLVIEARPVRGNAGSVICIMRPFQELQNTITQNANEGVPFLLVTRNARMNQLKEKVKQVAQHSSNVLITGESGTGKELFARAIHRASPRHSSPFVTVNCAAIPETLLESELFGYEEGAFTGAKKGGRIGKFMLANTGTLFLDEIGDMPLYLQAKLLRVLSDRQVDRIGSSKLVDVDVHIIAATNKNLEEMIGKKEFREDLYYRLNVIPFYIPPLRERCEDILPLIEHFIEKYNCKLGKHIRGISPQTLARLEKYGWPGNVRELENCIEYMVNFEMEDLLSEKNLPQRLRGEGENAPVGAAPAGPAMAAAPPPIWEGMPLKEQLRQYEARIFRTQNERYGGRPNLQQIRTICRELGISLSSYYRKLEELGLS